MGLMKAASGAVGGVLGDQWKEFFYCESLSPEILVAKGQKRLSSQGRSSNTSAEDNIISNGSAIAVNEGQCMIIVESGKVVDLCAEPGTYTYDIGTEPSLFSGDLASNIVSVFQNIGKRFTFGGDPGKDQRIYYFNTKEIIGNKYGTPAPIPVTVLVSKESGQLIDISVRCFGTYSYRIVNPMLFYTNVCGNVDDVYDRTQLDEQMKSELLTALQPAFARISDLGVRYAAIPGHTKELAEILNEELSKDWSELRGINIVKFAVSSIKATDEDELRIKDLQSYSTPGSMAAGLAGAQMGAMRAAASNPNGAGMGFMGLGMANMMGGANNLGGLMQQQQMMTQQQQQMQQQQQQMQPQAGMAAAAGWACACGQQGNTGKFCAGCGKPQPAPQGAAGWACSCGAQGNTGKFCANCGAAKPEEAAGWKCSCGAMNQGKFCPQCGGKKPEGEPLYACDKCGWQPEDPKHPPKFCPECGDIFDDNDKI